MGFGWLKSEISGLLSAKCLKTLTSAKIASILTSDITSSATIVQLVWQNCDNITWRSMLASAGDFRYVSTGLEHREVRATSAEPMVNRDWN